MSLFCRAALNSGECIFPKAVLQYWWVTAHLYEQQILIGVIAVTLGCCEPVLQSSTEQCGMYYGKVIAAVH